MARSKARGPDRNRVTRRWRRSSPRCPASQPRVRARAARALRQRGRRRYRRPCRLAHRPRNRAGARSRSRGNLQPPPERQRRRRRTLSERATRGCGLRRQSPSALPRSERKRRRDQLGVRAVRARLAPLEDNGEAGFGPPRCPPATRTGEQRGRSAGPRGAPGGLRRRHPQAPPRARRRPTRRLGSPGACRRRPSTRNSRRDA
jgi:hypothetical protein